MFQTLLVVQDFSPATWYIMDIVAHSDAGSTSTQLKFATLTFAGSKFLITLSSLHLCGESLSLAENKHLQNT